MFWEHLPRRSIPIKYTRKINNLNRLNAGVNDVRAVSFYKARSVDPHHLDLLVVTKHRSSSTGQPLCIKYYSSSDFPATISLPQPVIHLCNHLIICLFCLSLHTGETAAMSRRVVSRLIPLEPLHVIRAKDKRARELSLSGRIDSALTSVPESELQAFAETAGQEESSFGGNVQKSALRTESTTDSSRLANIAHESSATEQATSNAPQPTLNANSTLSSGEAQIEANTTNATSSADAAPPGKSVLVTGKEDSTAIKIQNMQQARTVEDVEPMSMSNEALDTAILPRKEKLLEPSKRESASLRPRRSTRKSYALPLELDVDWDEDLRPTDDEIDKSDVHGGSASTSPDPEYRTSTDRKSPKRKRRLSGLNSSKRRKVVKEKLTSVSKRGDRKVQLPLTTAPIVSPQTEVSGPHACSSSRAFTGQSEAVTTIHTAETLNTALPLFSEDQSQYHISDNVGRHEVIEISSGSSSSSKQSSPRCGIDQYSSHDSPTPNTYQGRGKVVGTKLSDALRESGLSSRRTIDPVTNSTQTLKAQTDHKKANATTSRKLLARISPFRASFTSESSVNQGQAESNSKRLVADSRMIRADYLNLPVETNLQGLFNDHAYMEINENADKATHAPMVTAIESTEPVNDKLANSQEYAQFMGNAVDAASQTSSAAGIEHQATLINHNNQSQNTPESEKPLLTKETPLQSIPQSAPRSTIVDCNGSPRLATEGNKNVQTWPLLIYDRMESIDMMGASSSSSDYDQSSDEYSPDYTPESQRTWSKFHRDIVAEYGIATEQLIHKGNRPISLSKACVSDTAACGTSHHDRQHTGKPLDTRSIISPRREVDTSAETRAHIDHEKASAIAATSSTSGIDEVGPCGRDRSVDRENPLTSRTADPSYPGLGPRASLMQNDTNGMEWISALQKAQRSAHDLLQATNQVISIN